MQITDKQAKNILFLLQRDKDYVHLSMFYTRNKYLKNPSYGGKCHLRK